MFIAFIKEIQVLRRQRRQEGIRIVDLMDVTPRRLVTNLITKSLFLRDKAFEETFRSQQLHGVRGGAGHIQFHHATFHSPADKGSHHDTGFSVVRQRVHAEPSMRIGLMIA